MTSACMMAQRLRDNLFETTGDAAATVQAMTAYYKRMFLKVSKNGPRPRANIKDAPVKYAKQWMCHRIEKELSDERIYKWALAVNEKYESAFMLKCTDFSAVRSRLVTKENITNFYHCFKDTFPVYHMVFATACSTSFSSVDHGWSCVEQTVRDDLDGKPRTIFKLFCDLLHAKSRESLPHYAMVQTLAFWYKGTAMPKLKCVVLR